MRSRRVPVVCGVDIGTSNAKAVAIDESGTVVARVTRPTPRERDGSAVDALALFDAVEDMVIKVCGDHFIAHAIATAGVGEDGFLLDGALRPLTSALGWSDPRRQDVFTAFSARLVDDLGEDLDVGTDPARTIVGWAWAMEHPNAAAARSWVSVTDLAGSYWAGRTFLSDTLASRTAAWSSRTRAWSQDRVTRSLGSEDLLPPVLGAGEVVGSLNSVRLRFAGVIAPDAIVVAGGHDHPIAGWGVERMTPGVVLDSMGTAEVIVTQAPLPSIHRADGIDVAPGIRSGGSTLLHVEELTRNVLWASRDRDVARHIRALIEGSEAPRPILEAGHFIPGGRGGGEPAFSADAPAEPRARASAVLGALAVAGRDAVNLISARAGARSEVRLAGGWARSPGWLEIKSAVNGVRTAPVLEPEVTAVGAAMLAAEAYGWAPDAARALGGFSAAIFH